MSTEFRPNSQFINIFLQFVTTCFQFINKKECFKILTPIWSAMIIAGIIATACVSGGEGVVLSLNKGIEKSFELFITLAPIMCFWSGIMEIAEQSRLTKIISRLLLPITKPLFGKSGTDTSTTEKITMNMSANLLGMGNAATPLGLNAIEALDRLNPFPERLSDAMCMFIIINTASIQLIPTSIIAFRTQCGSTSPSDILLPTIITTLAAFFVGTVSAKICSKIPLFN